MIKEIVKACEKMLRCYCHLGKAKLEHDTGHTADCKIHKHATSVLHSNVEIPHGNTMPQNSEPLETYLNSDETEKFLDFIKGSK